MLFRDAAVGTTRTSADLPITRRTLFPLLAAENQSADPRQGPPRGLTAAIDTPYEPPVARPLLRLSDGLAAFFTDWLPDRDLKAGTLAEYRKAAWMFVEFVGCDAPLRELPADTFRRFLRWLRGTAIAPRTPWSLPKAITPATVAAFLASAPSRETTQGDRREYSLQHYLAHVKPMLEFFGIPTAIPRRERPTLRLPPPMVPSLETIAAWWRDAVLHGAKGVRVVLTQALVFLTAMRIEETLKARIADVEGRFLLVRISKTGPRIIYLNRQALGIVAALHALPGATRKGRSGKKRPSSLQLALFDASDYLAAWGQSNSAWHKLVKLCTGAGLHNPRVKRHQCLRQRCATWLNRRDVPVHHAQLGHEGGVDLKHYVAVLEEMPKHLEDWRLPPLDVPGFEWPPPVDVPLRVPPERLYNEFYWLPRLVKQQGGKG